MSNWASAPAGSRPSTRPTPSRSPRWASGSTGLREQLDIITGLWTTPVGETFDYAGQHYTSRTRPRCPSPSRRPHPPIIIGGGGAKRTPALTAKFAAEFNIPFVPLDTLKTQYGRVAAAVADAGRAAGLADLFGGVRGVRRTRRRRGRPRAAAIGREVDELRSNSPLVGHARGDRRQARPVRRGRRAARVPAGSRHVRSGPPRVVRRPRSSRSSADRGVAAAPAATISARDRG